MRVKTKNGIVEFPEDIEGQIKLIIDTTELGNQVSIEKFTGFSDKAIGFLLEDEQLYTVIEPIDRTVVTIDGNPSYFGLEIAVEPFEHFFPVVEL